MHVKYYMDKLNKFREDREHLGLKTQMRDAYNSLSSGDVYAAIESIRIAANQYPDIRLADFSRRELNLPIRE